MINAEQAIQNWVEIFNEVTEKIPIKQNHQRHYRIKNDGQRISQYTNLLPENFQLYVKLLPPE